MAPDMRPSPSIVAPRTSPYSPPRSDLELDFERAASRDERGAAGEPAPLPPGQSRLTRHARLALGLALAPLGATAAIISLLVLGVGSANGRLLLVAIGVAGTLAGLAGVGLGARTSLRLFALERAIRPAGLASAVGSIGLGVLSAGLGALTTVLSLVSFSRGRQLRSFGRLAHAPLVEHAPDPAAPRATRAAGTAEADTPAATPGPTSRGCGPDAAGAWRKNGLTEHASIAAFARLSTELVALGAPSSLVADSHRDALDELAHTELCFALAEELDGRRIRPGPFPAAAARLPSGPITFRLARLAVESLVDGALNEGVSARVVAELARETEDPRVRSVLEVIAKDESRHAVHGFQVMRWCLERGGHPVRAALVAALGALPVELGRSLTPGAEDGSLEHLGIPGRAREERAFAIVRARLIERTGRLITETARASAQA